MMCEVNVDTTNLPTKIDKITKLVERDYPDPNILKPLVFGGETSRFKFSYVDDVGHEQSVIRKVQILGENEEIPFYRDLSSYARDAVNPNLLSFLSKIQRRNGFLIDKRGQNKVLNHIFFNFIDESGLFRVSQQKTLSLIQIHTVMTEEKEGDHWQYPFHREGLHQRDGNAQVEASDNKKIQELLQTQIFVKDASFSSHQRWICAMTYDELLPLNCSKF
eukprot:TRINITY_DN2394_c0_g2_i1.p1 TRINITY_DN2394_c0_g2~~TRINITY_DN2394_c0_g2_i1.p1  ORF type:complete len:219 (+),score=13.88 TRINITY_DN2394_c0_g2_i1:579-1235(+)